MATYVNDLRLKEIATGDESGTWGTSTNTNLELIGEAFSFGTEAISTNADTHTTTIADGATDPGRSIFLQYTGALDSDCTVTIGPNTVSKLWFIENATTDSGSSGPYNIIIKQGSGATVTIRNGQVKAIYSDGAGSGGKMVDAFTDLNVKNLITEQAGNTTGLQLISTDADAAVGPRLDLTRLSASPADDDAAGQIRFMANNDAGTETSFGFIRMLLSDVSSGSEDGLLEIDTRVAGTNRSRMEISSTETVFNQDSVDLDFRVESNAVTDALKVDAGNNQVIIGSGADLLTASAGSDNVRIGEGAGDTIASGGNDNVVIGKNAGTAITTADANVAIGTQALNTEDAHGGNVAVGYQALQTQNSGATVYNVAVGYQAGKAITTAQNNVAIGGQALKSANTGGNNVVIGYVAGDSMTTGNTNVAIGSAALGTNVEADRNVAIGYQALKTFNPGSDSDTYNVAIGYNAGLSQTTSTNNIFIGGLAGDANTTGGSNVAIGRSSLGADTTGIQSVAIGRGTLQAQNFSGSEATGNTAVGYNAGNDISTGLNNTLIGHSAGDALSDADLNVAVGDSALTADTLGSRSTAIGRSALSSQNFTSATNSNQTAVGFNAGTSITTGVQNTLVGSGAGDNLTTGTDNVAVGYAALDTEDAHGLNTAIGTLSLLNLNAGANAYNTAVGYASGSALTTGINNTIVGALAADALTDADQNTAMGYGALSRDEKGSRTTAVGYLALQDQDFDSSTDTNNTAVGWKAGNNLTTGQNNTFIGASAASSATVTGNSNNGVGVSALSALTSGANNTAIGDSAGSSVNSGDNNTLLGHDAGRTGSPGGNINTENNEIVLGDENISQAHIQVSLTVASDERDKTDFVDLDLGLDFVKALEPVTYYWDKRSKYGDKYADDYDLNAQTPDGTHKEDWMDIGFKAQSVLALEEAAGYKIAEKKNLTVSLSGDGKQYGLQYEKFIPILVKAIKDQDAIITSLTARVTALES